MTNYRADGARKDPRYMEIGERIAKQRWSKPFSEDDPAAAGERGLAVECALETTWSLGISSSEWENKALVALLDAGAPFTY